MQWCTRQRSIFACANILVPNSINKNFNKGEKEIGRPLIFWKHNYKHLHEVD